MHVRTDHTLKTTKKKKKENPPKTLYPSLKTMSMLLNNTTSCPHPGSIKDMCIKCGQRLEHKDQSAAVSFGYIHTELRLNNDEIVRVRRKDMKDLLRRKKLHLVLDLDHTLINSSKLRCLTSKEKYLKSKTDTKKGSLVHKMMTKLRPFVGTFLKQASEMYELHIYTMAQRAYALTIVNILDPRGEYFSGKVITRYDGTERNQKGLDVVLGQESAVLILDDAENVWTKHKENLILMERYHFFKSSCTKYGFDCDSLSEMKSDESETEGALATIIKLLKQIHNLFFQEPSDNLIDRDVRQVLKTLRNEVLRGCKIVVEADNHPLWNMAEQLGAICCTEYDLSVTHVVSTDAEASKYSNLAVKDNKFIVNPRWIEAANYLWQKQPEENFLVQQAKGYPHLFPCVPLASKERRGTNLI